MSCIVGLVHNKTVYMGCDSLGSDESCKMIRADPKIFRITGRPDSLIGFTTSFRMGQLLQYEHLLDPKAKISHKHVVTKMIPKILQIFDNGGFVKEDDDGRLGGQFLLAVKDRLFSIDVDFQVGENCCGYAAIGSGSPYALGSLFSTQDMGILPQDRIYLALKASAMFCPSVGSPFHLFSTTGKKELVLDTEKV